MMTKNTYNLVVGASGGIGYALSKLLEQSESDVGLISVSRSAQIDGLKSQHFCYHPDIADPNTSNADNLEKEVERCVDSMKETIGESLAIRRIFIAIGTLHSESYQPEKRIEELTATAAIQIQMINALLPIIWAKHLWKLCERSSPTKIVFISARVGSITDNRLGGWYSYRASKASLNMFVKTLSIELARRAKHISLLAVHPGTVDTGLSKPFQQRVPSGKLFTAEQSAEYMVTEVDKRAHSTDAQFIDWQGETVPW